MIILGIGWQPCLRNKQNKITYIKLFYSNFKNNNFSNFIKYKGFIKLTSIKKKIQGNSANTAIFSKKNKYNKKYVYL